MKKIVPILLAIVLAAAVLLPGCQTAPPAPEKTTLVMGSLSPAGHPVTQLLMEMAEVVKERTNGRLELEWHQHAELGFAGPDLLRIFETGSLGIGEMGGAYLVGQEPVMSVPNLPYMSSMESVPIVINTFRPFAEEVLDRHNIKLLLIINYPDGIWSKIPINTMDDVKELKIWSSALMVQQAMDRLGGSAVGMNVVEIYQALSTGILNGVGFCLTCGFGFRFYEVCKYMYPNPLLYHVQNFIVINKDVLESLPSDVQEVLIAAGKEYEPKVMNALNIPTDEQWKILEDAGVTVADINPQLAAQLVEIGGRPVWRQWVADNPDTKPAVDAMLSALGLSL